MTVVTGNNSTVSKIIKALGLPERTVDFKINFPLNDVVTVDCSYYPSGEGMEELGAIIKKYKLVTEEIEEMEEIKENMVDKGGINVRPTIPPPSPPKGQGKYNVSDKTAK